MSNTVITPLEKIKKILKNLDIEPEQIVPETKLNSIVDSLEIVEICMAIEQETNSIIADEEFENWETVNDIITTYNKKSA